MLATKLSLVDSAKSVYVFLPPLLVIPRLLSVLQVIPTEASLVVAGKNYKVTLYYSTPLLLT